MRFQYTRVTLSQQASGKISAYLIDLGKPLLKLIITAGFMARFRSVKCIFIVAFVLQ
ncbi:hypothetical protein HUSEC_07907 [Escherichia coli O104:H4 str. LB226692]|nr:hypothetical protein HUSEC_07907 [Escherichia coli O104:H4 str. LB226692]